MVSTKGEGKAAQSQRAREIDVREFKIWWSAETATMEEALSLRKRVIKSWRTATLTSAKRLKSSRNAGRSTDAVLRTAQYAYAEGFGRHDANSPS